MEGCAEVAFDAEGEELGRNGALTIAAFSGLGMDDTFVVDVQALGAELSNDTGEPFSSKDHFRLPKRQ